MGRYEYARGFSNPWSKYAWRRVPNNYPDDRPYIVVRNGKKYINSKQVNIPAIKVIYDYVGRRAVRKFRRGRILPGRNWKNRKEVVQAYHQGGHKLLDNEDWMRELASYM